VSIANTKSCQRPVDYTPEIGSTVTTGSQSLDAALMRAIKRRDNAFRQLGHWRDGLGLKACRPSNLFIAAACNGAVGQRA
jgi:hypothetical protein